MLGKLVYISKVEKNEHTSNYSRKITPVELSKAIFAENIKERTVLVNNPRMLCNK